MSDWLTKAGLSNSSMEGLRDYVGQEEKIYYGMWCTGCVHASSTQKRGKLVSVSRARIHLKKCPRCSDTRLYFDTITSRQYDNYRGKGLYTGATQ